MPVARLVAWVGAAAGPLLVAAFTPHDTDHALFAGAALMFVVAASSLLGGVGPGLLAGMGSAAVGVLSFAEPIDDFGAPASATTLVAAAVYPAVGVVAGWTRRTLGLAREHERRAAARLARLQRITEALANVVETTDVTLAVEHACRELGAARGTLSVVDVDADLVSFVGAVGIEPDVAESWSVFPLSADLPASEAARTGEMVFLPSKAERDERYPALAGLPPNGEHALVCVPAWIASRPVGVLTLTFDGGLTMDSDTSTFLGSVGDQCGQALERARLFRQATEARDRASLLADATAAVGRSLDVDEALERLLAQLVPRLVDAAAVHLLQRGEARLVASKPEGWAPTPGSARLLPLRVGQRLVGHVSVMFDSGRAAVAPADAELLRALVGRAAVAVDNALSHTAVVEQAELLQRSLLPGRDPAVPGLDVAVHYRAVGGGVVGGDVFDVAALGDGRWLALMGDVSGKGIEAAATTALLRHSVRAFARVDPDPCEVLARVNAVMVDADLGERFATAVVVVIEPGDVMRMHLASAGHPLPLLRRAEGTVEEVGAPGGALGLFPDVTFEAATCELEPGDAVLLFTDGLLEARDESGQFSAVIAERALAAAAGGDARATVDAVVAAISGFEAEPRDDLALMAFVRPASDAPLLPVVVDDVDAQVVVDADAYLQALVRESALVAFDASRPNVLSVAAELLERYAAVRREARRQADAALDAGRGRVDLELWLPPIAQRAARELLAVVDQIVPLLGTGALLIPPPSSAAIDVVRRVCQATVDQLAIAETAGIGAPPAAGAVAGNPPVLLPVAAPAVTTVVERLTASLPASPESPGFARRLLTQAVRDWSIPTAVGERAALVVSELVTNAVLHARTAVDVVVGRLEGGGLRVEVGDGSSMLPEAGGHAVGEATGNGLALVLAAASSCGVWPSQDGGGKVLWADVR